MGLRGTAFLLCRYCFVFLLRIAVSDPGKLRQNSMLIAKGVRRMLLLLAICIVARPASTCAQSAADAPTATVSPEVIDQTWQKASAKYDGARAAILANVDRVNADGSFRPDWESLQNYQVPEWYKDAKFGIFIHWGVYSVPAFANEWYPRNMYIEGSNEYKHHI